jgi:hypothetical protein
MGAVVLFLEREEKCEEEGNTEDGEDDYKNKVRGVDVVFRGGWGGDGPAG